MKSNNNTIIFCTLLAILASTNSQICSGPIDTPRNVLSTSEHKKFDEIQSMSDDDVRNAIIVELSKNTTDNVDYYKSKTDDELVGISGVYLGLLCSGMSWDQLNSLSANGIVEIGRQKVRNCNVISPELLSTASSLKIAEIGRNLNNGWTKCRI